MTKTSLAWSAAAVLGMSLACPTGSDACDRRPVYVQRQHVVQLVEARPVTLIQHETVLVPAKTEVIAVERVAVPNHRAKSKVIEVPSGSTVKLSAAFLGRETGFVFVKINDVVLDARVTDWQPSLVVADLPVLGILNPTLAQIQIVTPNGELKKVIDVALLPANEDLVVVPKSESQQLPGSPAAAFNGR